MKHRNTNREAAATVREEEGKILVLDMVSHGLHPECYELTEEEAVALAGQLMEAAGYDFTVSK